MFSISATFLGGWFHGTAPGQGSEWPPHPTRLVQALIASWFNGDTDKSEAEAIRWVESLEPPTIISPHHAPEEAYDSWVPMNSLPNWAKSSGKRPTMPKLTSTIAGRFVGDDPIVFVWDVDIPDHLAPSMSSLCQRCTRLGTSDSMVMLSSGSVEDAFVGAWRPSPLGRTVIRTPFAGTLDHTRPDAGPMPGRVAPTHWTRYSWSQTGRPGRMVTLGLVQGSWPVERTLLLTRRLRQAVMASAEDAGIPISKLIHGHDDFGAPLRTRHVSFCALPHVGHRYAHGSVIGVSFVTPTGASDEQASLVSDAIAAWVDAGATLGFSDGTALRFDIPDSRKALEDETWSQPSRTWVTAVPMELPRHVVKRQGWNGGTWRRVGVAIKRACAYEGLPVPENIVASKSPPLVGSPHTRAMCGDFERPLMHVELTFPVAVEGPLILGSSNHFGLGLMVPTDAS
jgi:CRISPR-associated protein Csb2